jgi:flagellar hook-associated protein 3 FlgL
MATISRSTVDQPVDLQHRAGFIDALRAPGTGAAGQASLTNKLNQLQVNIDGQRQCVVGAGGGGFAPERAGLPRQLRRRPGLQYATTLSNLQDVDYTAAISLFTQQQTTLTAAQKSFTTMSGLSLFNYIS